jgi:hypothetical protein
MSDSKTKEVNITTRIKALKVVDFSVEKIQEDELKKLDISKYSFEQSVNLRISPVVKLLEILYKTTVFTDEQKHKKLGEITAIGEFEILNLDEFKTGEDLAVPRELLAMYVGIMIATVRGIIIAKSEGTSLEGAILPILNPIDFFKSPN